MRSLADMYERCNFVSDEPASFEETFKEFVRKEAMNEEIRMIQKDNTWTLVPKLEGKKPIKV